jgi:hypothetical protein
MTAAPMKERPAVPLMEEAKVGRAEQVRMAAPLEAKEGKKGRAEGT